MNKLKRNTLAVRLEDDDYDQFLVLAGDNYSLTLRALIKLFNECSIPEDKFLPPGKRVKTAMGRLCD